MASDAALNRLALETSTAQQARRTALNELLNLYGPGRINDYVQRPTSAYFDSMNKGTIEKFFKETDQRIPKGTEMYRAPSMGEVNERLPREIGASYRPGIINSTASASDLQALGELLAGKKASTGGSQNYAPGLAKITAMTDLPGIYDTDEFLKKAGYKTKTGWNLESILGPKTRYEVQGFTPGKGNVPPTWNLGAYANMGLGAANVLGFLPMLMQGGNIMTGRDTSMLPNDPTIGQMR
jgi:hypothetical protein